MRRESITPRICSHCGSAYTIREREQPCEFRVRNTCSNECRYKRVQAVAIERQWKDAVPGEIPFPDGVVAYVDLADWERCRSYCWNHVHSRHPYVKNSEVGTLHRFIVGAQPGDYVDHKDNDPLNNRRANLRVTTCQNNLVNSRISSRNTSGFKGVSLHAGRWRSKIGTTVLGYFANPEDAAVAYDQAARKLYDGLARLNFPNDGESSVTNNSR